MTEKKIEKRKKKVSKMPSYSIEFWQEQLRLLKETDEHFKTAPRPFYFQTMADAYRDLCKGIDPWIAIGNFRNAWYGYGRHVRQELVSGPIPEPEPDTEYNRNWGAFCAAAVEFLCERYNVPC